MQEKAEEGRRIIPRGLVLIAVIAIGLWVCWWVFVGLGFATIAQAAELGDAFGGINALFAALAFAGVIYAIFLQRDELELQRQELRYTRAEISRQAEQMEMQTKTLRLQSFENTFFQMLRLHHEIVNGMTYARPSGGRPLEGREIFNFVRNELAHRIGPSLTGPVDDPREVIDEAWESMFRRYQSFLGHYFRNLYHALKLVDEADAHVEKQRYASLVRAQLSSDEHFLFFCNGASRHGSARLRALIEKYALLENLNRDLIPDARLLGAYDSAAYGSDAAART